MNWADDIDEALRRSGGRYSFADLFRWLRSGEAEMFVCGSMHGSVWFRDGGAEIAHVAGHWNAEDANWLYDRAMQAIKERGITQLEANGRPGWRRFLRMEGFQHGRNR